MQRDLVEYITTGIISFLDRQPPELSEFASDDVIQMAILREYVEGQVGALEQTSKMEVAAIQMHDGHFELLCLDAPLIPGTRSDRILAVDRAQLAESVGILLPNVSPEDGLKQALGGVIVVDRDCWLEAKRIAF